MAVRARRPPTPAPPARPAERAGTPAPRSASSAAFPGVAALEALRRDAVERAWRARTEGASAGLDLGVEQDLARYADRVLDEGGIDELARQSGRTGRELVRLALAWRHGGARGVDLVTGAETPDPSPDMLAIVEAAAGERRGPGRRITTRAGWVQVDAGVRLGRARDGRWYRVDRVGPGMGAPPTTHRRRGRPPRRRLTDRVPAYWSSNALAGPVRQLSASSSESGSGEMSSSPCSSSRNVVPSPPTD